MFLLKTILVSFNTKYDLGGEDNFFNISAFIVLEIFLYILIGTLILRSGNEFFSNDFGVCLRY